GPVAPAARRPGAAGRGSAPAELGPTRRAPPASTQAMEPPPALTVCTSTIGSLTGTPATTDSVVVCPTPPSPGAPSVGGPPMSKGRGSWKPLRPATHAAPTTPPAGPERRQLTAWAA